MIEVQLLRGTATQVAGFTGPIGLITVDTTNWLLYLHDGVTAGGHLIGIMQPGGLTAHAVLLGEGTGAPGYATIGTANRVLADNGASADPSFKTLTALIDAAFGSAEGDLLQRGSGGWQVLTPGTSGYFLQTQGASALAQWAAGSGGTLTSITAGAGLTTTKGSTGGSLTTTGTLYEQVSVDARTTTTEAISDSDQAKLVTFSNGSATAVSIAQANHSSAFLTNWFCFVQNLGAGTVTITPTTSTINGNATLVLKTGQGVMIVSDGTNYQVNGNVAAASSTLAGDTDVSFTSLAQYDIMVYSGSAWNNQRPKYVIAFSFTGGVLANSQLLGLHQVSKGITIPANFGSYLGHASQASGTANATGSTAVVVNKLSGGATGSSSSIGTITFASSSVTPTFATTSGTAKTLSQGDVVQVIGPSTADATFANFLCTIVAYET